MRTLRLAREAGGWTLVKLEVLGDRKTLYPDMIETLRATEMLIKEGFQVMVYCSDDPLMAKRLEELGAAAIMPLAAPIGSGLGVQNPVNIRMIVEEAKVPVIVDAGVGTASDAAVAMELGCDAVLMNTAIAEAKDPVMMARAMSHAVEAGRLAYLAGRMAKKRYADPSSPLAGLDLEGLRWYLSLVDTIRVQAMADSGIAKIFKHGRSQAVRLPAQFRLPGTEVRVTRIGRQYCARRRWKSISRISLPNSIACFRDVSWRQGRDQPPMPPDDDLDSFD